jgi:hypothetical protein
VSRVPNLRPVEQRKPRVPDKDRLALIRQMPCCLCNAPPPSEAAHIRFGHVGGTSLKPPDDLTVPLCHDHHDAETRMGPPLFWRTKLSTDPVLASKAMHAFARSLVKS